MTHVIAHLPPVQQAKNDLAPSTVCSCPLTCALGEHVPCVSGGEVSLATRRRCDFGFAYVFSAKPTTPKVWSKLAKTCPACTETFRRVQDFLKTGVTNLARRGPEDAASRLRGNAARSTPSISIGWARPMGPVDRKQTEIR
jgi:hypothetical protein